MEKEPVTMQLPALLPGVQMVTDTALTTKDLPGLAGNEGVYQIWIGAEDPMTGRPQCGWRWMWSMWMGETGCFN